MLKELLEECVAHINERIEKSNDAKDARKNALFAPLVLLAQNECDRILGDASKSFLERIFLCGDSVVRYRAGNCMMQSYVAFSHILKELLRTKQITMEGTYAISICTTKNHTFLIVNDLVCDPWANYVGPLKGSLAAGKKVRTYFAIAPDWRCYDSRFYDEKSTLYTYELVKQFAPTESDIERPDSDIEMSLTPQNSMKK